MPLLTVDTLCTEAALFSALESQHPEPLIYGITDGKAVGTYLEQKFKNYLKGNYDFVLGNSASGIDFPELLIDMKTTRIKQHKRLHFQLIGEIDNKSTLFDDTVYFISFEKKKEAEDTCLLLNSETIKNFYSSLIFWDEKRPIKANILNKLDIEKAYKLLNNYN